MVDPRRSTTLERRHLALASSRRECRVERRRSAIPSCSGINAALKSASSHLEPVVRARIVTTTACRGRGTESVTRLAGPTASLPHCVGTICRGRHVSAPTSVCHLSRGCGGGPSILTGGVKALNTSERETQLLEANRFMRCARLPGVMHPRRRSVQGTFRGGALAT